MAKTQEELNQLKTEYETLNNKLKELTEEELNMVTGGILGIPSVSADNTNCIQHSSTRYGYAAIDNSKPQSCGNCQSYNHGKCWSGRGG